MTDDPSQTWTALRWDSEFFGFGIGRIELDGADQGSIATAEAEARAQGIACLYGSLDPIDAHATFLVQTLGYRLVDVATTFDLRLDEPPIPKPPDTDFRVGTVDDIPLVAGIAERMADWSRYAVDPRFGVEAARRMQTAWLERAARGDDGVHSLMVAETDDGIHAFIGRVLTPRPRVDAVGTTRRGSGAARYLIQEARGWAGQDALLGGPIAARNVPALRYVSHCNYRVCEVRYLYHRWLDEDLGVT